eukprot:13776465-Alexandrium_andersonii.AAC.1
MDVTCFNMPVPVHGGQVNAVARLVRETSWASILETTFFWKSIWPFCVAYAGKNEVDWFHHGDQ